MINKLPTGKIEKAVQTLLENSLLKKRKFLESVELQISLRNYDPKRDKRFSGIISLPFTPKINKKCAVIGDAAHLAQAKNLNIEGLSIEDLKKLNKNKKLIKKLAKKYDLFLASDTLIKLIPRVLGPGLNKAGKFPSVVSQNESLEEKIEYLKKCIKIELKKVLCLGLLVGNVSMTKNMLSENVKTAINFLVSLLKKNWQNVGTIYLKSTMSKPVKIF